MLSKVSVSNSDGVKVKQILWNPVIANTLAVCLSDGSLGAYVIKPNSFEYNSLDKSENAWYFYNSVQFIIGGKNKMNK